MFPAVVVSHELEDGDSLMLLSLHAQATLGLLKDVELGTCYMRREEVWLQLYEIVGSNLRAIVVWNMDWERPIQH